jgi:hypothetical protein
LHANQGNNSPNFTFGREKQGRPWQWGKDLTQRREAASQVQSLLWKEFLVSWLPYGVVFDCGLAALRPGALALKMNQCNTGNAPDGSGTNSWNDSAARSKKEEILQQTRGLERKLLEEAAQNKADQSPPAGPVCGHKLTRQTRDQERT